jgi:hypothetical protein
MNENLSAILCLNLMLVQENGTNTDMPSMLDLPWRRSSLEYNSFAVNVNNVI